MSRSLNSFDSPVVNLLPTVVMTETLKSKLLQKLRGCLFNAHCNSPIRTIFAIFSEVKQWWNNNMLTYRSSLHTFKFNMKVQQILKKLSHHSIEPLKVLLVILSEPFVTFYLSNWWFDEKNSSQVAIYPRAPTSICTWHTDTNLNDFSHSGQFHGNSEGLSIQKILQSGTVVDHYASHYLRHLEEV